MGYRSQVVLAISPEAAPAFMALCAKHPKVMQLCQDADDFTSGYESPGDYFMFWSSIKWYQDYPEIDMLYRFVCSLEEDDLTEYGESGDPDGIEWNECFKFIRIGEDYEDYDQRGYGFPDIMTYRSISF
tara:strand:- start:103 stop:489 length:387 start_codon:yes stop_codon:yes gene_type:complete